MSCVIEDSRGGFFVEELAAGCDGFSLAASWTEEELEEAEERGWYVVVGDGGCHITVVDGAFDTEANARAAADAMNKAIA